MSQLVLARGVTKRSFLRRFIPNVEVGPYFLVSSLVIFVVLITVVTLMFSTRQVTKGYVLNELESQHQDLVKQSEQREMEISTVRSLQFIQDSKRARRMVRPGNVVYVSAEAAIASR